jgi:hypothetical protein
MKNKFDPWGFLQDEGFGFLPSHQEMNACIRYYMNIKAKVDLMTKKEIDEHNELILRRRGIK